MLEIQNMQPPLATTTFLKVLSGIEFINEDNKVESFANLIKVVTSAVEDKTIQGNDEILKLFNELKKILETGDLSVLKEFAENQIKAVKHFL
jgi:hypothetical protein